VPWTSNVRIPNQQSKNSPALAEFRGELHMCHAGDSSNDIWHSVFDGAEWSANVRITDQKSKAPSALAWERFVEWGASFTRRLAACRTFVSGNLDYTGLH